VKIITACKEVEIPLYVDYRRAMPRFVKIKDLLEQKVIGDVRFISTIQYQKATEEFAKSSVAGSARISRRETVF
jgi:predicted dehydrogenase